MKPEFQALRKFAQGVYIPRPASNTKSKSNISPNNQHETNIIPDNTEVKTFLDIISLNRLHKQKNHILECGCLNGCQKMSTRRNLRRSNRLLHSEQSKLPVCSQHPLTHSPNQQKDLLSLVKPKFHAYRKFAQGSYIPSNNLSYIKRRTKVKPKNVKSKKVECINTEAKTFLDMISFNQCHQHTNNS